MHMNSSVTDNFWWWKKTKEDMIWFLGDFMHLDENCSRTVKWIYDLEKGRVERIIWGLTGKIVMCSEKQTNKQTNKQQQQQQKTIEQCLLMVSI
jgi:calcineurin-like phosphoesterase family protein